MVQISPRISLDTRNWLDKKIKEQEFRSNGHAVEKMVRFYTHGHRLIARMKMENAQLRREVELFRNGELQATEQKELAVER